MTNITHVGQVLMVPQGNMYTQGAISTSGQLAEGHHIVMGC